MFPVRTEVDFGRIEEFCRRQIYRDSFLSSHRKGLSAQVGGQLAERIRERVLHETVSTLRRVFVPGSADESSLDEGRSGAVPRLHLSQRLSTIVREETGGLLGGGRMVVPHGTAGRAIGGDALSRDAAASFASAFDPGGDEIGGADLWDATVAGFEREYSSPVPWKPVWKGPYSGCDSWVFAVALDDAPFNWAKLTIERGAGSHPGPPGPNEVVLGLANATDWAKELWYWNAFDGNRERLHLPEVSTEPVVRTVVVDAPPYPPNPLPSLVFRKLGFLGIWHDVGHFPLHHTRLFEFFAGTVATFTWVVD